MAAFVARGGSAAASFRSAFPAGAVELPGGDPPGEPAGACWVAGAEGAAKLELIRARRL